MTAQAEVSDAGPPSASGSRPEARPLPATVVGGGPPVVLLHGFALRPRTYMGVASRLAPTCTVLIPELFSLPERWTYENVVACLEATLDARRIPRATFIGHSFGGAFGLGLAARSPERVVEAVFCDTLGLAREWVLARDALRPTTMVRMASVRAAVDFLATCACHPMQLSRAGWWGFVGDRSHEIEAVARAGVKAHVLWAARDTLLSRQDGLAFARELGATFTIARVAPGGKPLDHDWMFRHPHTFVAHLRSLGLEALPP